MKITTFEDGFAKVKKCSSALVNNEKLYIMNNGSITDIYDINYKSNFYIEDLRSNINASFERYFNEFCKDMCKIDCDNGFEDASRFYNKAEYQEYCKKIVQNDEEYRQLFTKKIIERMYDDEMNINMYDLQLQYNDKMSFEANKEIIKNIYLKGIE